MKEKLNLNRKTLGIMYIVSAAFFFALMSLFVRLSGDLPTFQKVFFRNIIAAIISFLLVIKSKESLKMDKTSLKLLLVRATAGTLGMFCNFYAIDHMNIADANMLNKLSPFFAMLISYFLLKEKAGKVDILITLIAFIGAGFVAKPGFNLNGSDTAAFIAIMGGLFSGLAYTMVRMVGKRGVKGIIIVFFFSAYSSIISFILLLTNYKPMTVIQLLLLIAAGFSAMMGQITMTKAYTYAPAKEIGTFDYTQVVYSAIMGIIFLGELPDVYSFIGYTIIIGMAVLKWRYNQKVN